MTKNYCMCYNILSDIKNKKGIMLYTIENIKSAFLCRRCLSIIQQKTIYRIEGKMSLEPNRDIRIYHICFSLKEKNDISVSSLGGAAITEVTESTMMARNGIHILDIARKAFDVDAVIKCFYVLLPKQQFNQFLSIKNKEQEKRKSCLKTQITICMMSSL